MATAVPASFQADDAPASFQPDSPEPTGQTPGASQITGISAQPQSTGIRDSIARWSENVMNDIKNGTDVTGVGTILKKMGAHGVYSGAPEAVGDFMASLPLGLARATKGAAEITQSGKTLQGTKDIVGGGMQAATIPASFAGGAATEGAAGLIPNTERAGAALNEVMGAAKNIPVDLSATGDAALKAAKLAESGGSMPKVIRDFLRRATDPEKGPMTYEEARDFYSNATRLSADEAGRLTGVMKKQLTDFTVALKEATREAAARAGKGQKFDQAMKEYRNAIQLKDAKEKITEMAKDALTKVVIPTGAGYAILKNLAK